MVKKTKPDPPKCYIDACVFLSYIEETDDRIKAIDCLFGECERTDREGHSCHLSIAEVAFAKWEKEQKTLEPDVEAKIDSLWHPQSPFVLAELSESIAREANHLFASQWKTDGRLRGTMPYTSRLQERSALPSFSPTTTNFTNLMASWDSKSSTLTNRNTLCRLDSRQRSRETNGITDH